MSSKYAVLWILDVMYMLGNTVLFIYVLFTSSACAFILCESEVIIKFL